MCDQFFVQNNSQSSEPWQVPSFFGRDLGPQAFNRPTSCPLYQVIDTESSLKIDTAAPTRSARGGTEVTLGSRMQGPTPFDYNHPQIAQPRDVRLPQVFTRDNGNYPQQYSDNPNMFYSTA